MNDAYRGNQEASQSQDDRLSAERASRSFRGPAPRAGAPDEVFSVRSAISKLSQQQERGPDAGKGSRLDVKERYKQALKDRVSSQASQRQDKTSQDRLSNRSRSAADRESFRAFSNTISNRVQDINRQKSSPLRQKGPKDDEGEEGNQSIRIGLGMDNNSFEMRKVTPERNQIDRNKITEQIQRDIQNAQLQERQRQERTHELQKAQSPLRVKPQASPSRQPMSQPNLQTFEQRQSTRQSPENRQVEPQPQINASAALPLRSQSQQIREPAPNVQPQQYPQQFVQNPQQMPTSQQMTQPLGGQYPNYHEVNMFQSHGNQMQMSQNLLSSGNANENMNSIYDRIANLRSNLNNNFLTPKAGLVSSGQFGSSGLNGNQQSMGNNSMGHLSSGALNYSRTGGRQANHNIQSQYEPNALLQSSAAYNMNQQSQNQLMLQDLNDNQNLQRRPDPQLGHFGGGFMPVQQYQQQYQQYNAQPMPPAPNQVQYNTYNPQIQNHPPSQNLITNQEPPIPFNRLRSAERSHSPLRERDYHSDYHRDDNATKLSQQREVEIALQEARGAQDQQIYHPVRNKTQSRERETNSRNVNYSQSPKRSRSRSAEKKQHYAQVRQMFSLPSQMTGPPSAEQGKKLDECLKVMDSMQRQIKKYEDTGKLENKQADMYNELLIKYNTLLYKNNTQDLDQESVPGDVDSQNKYQVLRMKSPSQTRSQKSRSKNLNNTAKTPNADLLLHGRSDQQVLGNFMVRADQLDNSRVSEPLYVEDNCERANPNQLRDPRLTTLEDENRALKELMKKQKAKTKFYKVRYNQMRASLDHYMKQNQQKATNWASQCGTQNMSFKRSASAKNISPFVHATQRDLKFKNSSCRNSALSLTRKISSQHFQSSKSQGRRIGATVPPGAAMLGPMPLSQAGLFNCALTVKNEKSKIKEPVSTIQLHRQIFNRDRLIEKQDDNIKKLKMKVASSGIPGSNSCCCDELRTIFEQKEQKLIQLSDYWRTKTQQLISQHQQKIQKLKNQQINLHQSAHFEIKQMKQYLEAVIKNICKRQDDIVDVYEKKVQLQKKENKDLVKRIVSNRNGSAPRIKKVKVKRNEPVYDFGQEYRTQQQLGQFQMN